MTNFLIFLWLIAVIVALWWALWAALVSPLVEWALLKHTKRMMSRWRDPDGGTCEACGGTDGRHIWNEQEVDHFYEQGKRAFIKGFTWQPFTHERYRGPVGPLEED